MLESIGITLLLIMVFGPVFYCSWLLTMLLKHVHEFVLKSRFEKSFRQAVKNHQPSWEEIKALAMAHQLSPTIAMPVIRKVYCTILTDEAPSANSLAAKKELIWDYMVQYQKDEPFEDIPSEIRIHLIRLRDQLHGHEHLLTPLTDKLKELLAVKNWENFRLKFFTVGGFMVGIVGLAFAVSSYLTP